MKRTAIRPISDKKKSQLTLERHLRERLYIKQGGLCYDCKGKPDWRGWQKYELIFRSPSGDSTDEENCVLLCTPCHSARLGKREIDSVIHHQQEGL